MSAIVESIAVFGSVARASSDAISDKDVLVVASDPNNRRLLAEDWKSRGWSVSVFAPQHLEAMASVGSLFLQHLRFEALIQVDKDAWLSSLLARARPKKSYANDFASSADLFLPLYLLGDTSDERLFAADVAYVYLRNAGILLNADVGRFDFDFGSIALELATRFDLSSHERSSLSKLRCFKNAYRSRRIEPLAPTAELWIALCEKVSGRSKAGPTDFARPAGYAAVRDLERRLIQNWSIVDLDNGAVPEEVSRLWRIVTSPRDYRWDVRHSGRLTRELDSLIRNRSFIDNLSSAKRALSDSYTSLKGGDRFKRYARHHTRSLQHSS